MFYVIYLRVQSGIRLFVSLVIYSMAWKNTAQQSRLVYVSTWGIFSVGCTAPISLIAYETGRPIQANTSIPGAVDSGAAGAAALAGKMERGQNYVFASPHLKRQNIF